MSMPDSAVQYLASLLAEFEPTLPIPDLVASVNKVYHAIEANDYDAAHDEIAAQLPEKWRALLGLVGHEGSAIRVLDFGSGTGFAAAQALDFLGPRLAALTCFDPSPEMLAHAEKRLSTRYPAVKLVSDLAAIEGPFDLLLTNSVLHHLPDIEATITGLEQLLTPDAWWVLGHEPSARFYGNPACVATLDAFRKQLRWRRFLDARRYRDFLHGVLHGDVRVLTAKRCLRHGWFRKQPTARAINRIVDVGVAHDVHEAKAGRGLDVHALKQTWQGRWRLHHVTTYSFMGESYEQRLPRAWQVKAQALKQQFPDDGAQFMAVWQRQPRPSP